uniref:pyridoxal kinase n=1 Tax=Plectus sambesii TaxID=2011161 RepID=A0A914UV81_9BILA
MARMGPDTGGVSSQASRAFSSFRRVWKYSPHRSRILMNADGSFDRYRFEIARLSGFFVGTGDVFTSLLIAWLHHCDNRIKCAVEKVLATIQTILRRTLTEAKALAGEGNVPDCGQVELRLIQSRDDILEPKLRIESTKL